MNTQDNIPARIREILSPAARRIPARGFPLAPAASRRPQAAAECHSCAAQRDRGRADADFGHRSRHETAIMEVMVLIQGIDYLRSNLRKFMRRRAGT